MLRYPTRGSAPPVSAALVIALILALAAPAATQNFDLETLGTAPEVDTSALLEVLHKKWKGSNPGKNADDIPALAKMPSNLFGVAVVTVDGKVFTAGDVDQPFSIQSISTAFTLAKAVKENGSSVIEEMIGVNATDQTFDSIAAVEQSKGRAMNPFVTPGAIATTALVKGATADEVWGKIIGIHSDFAGRPLKVNEEVYKSASENNRRNQAMAKLMHDHGRIKGDPSQAADLYTRQCSIEITTRDLAVMAATLANGGRNPMTKKEVVVRGVAAQVLEVMAIAGLNDDSGKWMFHAGLPAKSGVSGGIIAVSPGKFGLAAFSPPIDAAGNSVRAQKVITDVSNALDGSPYEVKPK